MKLLNFDDYPFGAKIYNGGTGTKHAIIINNDLYMLKFPNRTKIVTELSYRNSSITEYISCQIIKSIGLNVQDTVLGVATKLNSKGERSEYLAVACRDFVPEGYSLLEFANIKDITTKTHSGIKSVSLEAIEQTIDNQKIFPIAPKTFREFFWSQFIVDTLLSNFDRHNANWGVIAQVKNPNNARIAPIYDCGGCLFPMMDAKGMQKTLKDKKLQEHYTYSYPQSAITINKKRIKPYEFLLNTSNIYALKALDVIVARIDMAKISNIINAVPCIDELQKDFYNTIISNRYEFVLKHCLEHNPNVDLYIDERKIDNVSFEFNSVEVEYFKR